MWFPQSLILNMRPQSQRGEAETSTRNMAIILITDASRLLWPQNPSLYLSPSFCLFAEICHIAQGPSARQGATMYNPTENKSPRSNTAQLLKQASEHRRHGAVLRPSETLWRLWFSKTPPPPSTPLTNPAVLPFNASQPVLTFSLFKHCWTLLAPDRGRVGLDNDMPYATLPLQLSEPCMDQLRHNSIWNLILLS